MDNAAEKIERALTTSILRGEFVVGARLPISHKVEKLTPQKIVIGVDQSLDSLLALPVLTTVLDQHDLSALWIQVELKKSAPLPAAEDQTRSAQHKHHRVSNVIALSKSTPMKSQRPLTSNYQD